MIRGSWGSVQFQDVTADSSGRTGFSFQVGKNVGGSGQFLVTDKSTNTFLMQDYSLVQVQESRTRSIHLSSTVWHYGDIITWSATGLTPKAVIQVMIIDRRNGGLRLWDVTADLSGSAGYSFVVGKNILGSGQFTIINAADGSVLTCNYTLQ